MKLRNDHIYKFQCSNKYLYLLHTESSKAIMSRLSFLPSLVDVLSCFYFVILFISIFYLFIYYFLDVFRNKWFLVNLTKFLV